MKELKRLKATNGTIIVYEDRVVISRKGLAAFATQGGFQGDRTIFYRDLAGVDYKKPGWTNGYMQFIVNGTLATPARVGLMKTSAKSAADQNTVILRAFNKKTPQESEELYKLSLSKIEEYKVGSENVSPRTQADELREYKKLLDEGIITQAEFETKKREILNQA